MLKLPAFLHHGDAALGASVGVIGSLSIAAAVPAPHTLWELLPYLFPLVGAVVPVVAKRFLYGGAAGDKVRAAQKRARAAKLPEGSPERVKLEAEADELDASAAEKEAAATTK